jgi:hypothetical protein
MKLPINKPIQSIEIMYYSPAEATREIKKRIRNGAVIVFTTHLEDQMCDRHIDGQEVETAIKSGSVRTPGELKNDEYRYKIESNLNGGIAVVVEIPEDDPSVIVITTFRPPKKKIRRV